MNRASELETQINKLERLISIANKEYEEKALVLVNTCLKKLRPKKFKSKFDRDLALLNIKHYQGYELKEIKAIVNNCLINDLELKRLSNAIREAHLACSSNRNEIENIIKGNEQLNKKYASILSKPREIKQVSGTSMPNLPWEEYFISKYL
jgi:DNA repair ATPase RecN